jgi:hypothetical protein
MRVLAAVLLAVLPLTALSAQTTTAPAPHVVVETVGPDGWRLRFGPTNVGSLVESEQGRALWQPGVLPILAGWQQLVGDATTFAGAKERLLGHSGRVRLAVWFDEGRFEQRPLKKAALLVDGDGRTDLTALAADLAHLQGRMPGEWQDQDVGDRKHRVRQIGDKVLTAATVIDGRVAIFYASQEDLDAVVTAGSAFAGPAAAAKPLPPNTPALQIHVNVPALMAMALAAGNKEGNAFLQALGLAELGKAKLVLGTAGPHVQLAYQQELPATPRGLVAAFAPATPGVSTLQRLVPKDVASWKVGHFDLGAVFDGVIDAIDAMGWGNDEAEIRAEMKQELGFDPSEALFPHVTDEMLFAGSSLRGLDRPEDFTWVLGWRLKDEKAFVPNFQTLLGKAKPMLSREAAATVHGMELQRFGNMMGYDVWTATGNGLVLVGGGRDVEETLTTIARNASAPAPAADVEPAAAATTPFAVVRPHLPPGLTGLAHGDLDSVLLAPTEWWTVEVWGMGLFPFRRAPDGDSDPESREATRELLRKHNLATVRTATGRDGRTFHWRLYW